MSEPQRQLRGLGRLAGRIGIEPSYLSRFLNQPGVHFSEELLYRLCCELGMTQQEVDLLTLLGEWDRTQFPERRCHLERRISKYPDPIVQSLLVPQSIV
jgi:transcriptional regulator with XRE-family HTH domain